MKPRHANIQRSSSGKRRCRPPVDVRSLSWGGGCTKPTDSAGGVDRPASSIRKPRRRSMMCSPRSAAICSAAARLVRSIANSRSSSAIRRAYSGRSLMPSAHPREWECPAPGAAPPPRGPRHRWTRRCRTSWHRGVGLPRYAAAKLPSPHRTAELPHSATNVDGRGPPSCPYPSELCPCCSRRPMAPQRGYPLR